MRSWNTVRISGHWTTAIPNFIVDNAHTGHAAGYTINNAPSILHIKWCTTNIAQYTQLNSDDYTLHSEHYTLDSAHYTLHRTAQ